MTAPPSGPSPFGLRLKRRRKTNSAKRAITAIVAAMVIPAMAPGCRPPSPSPPSSHSAPPSPLLARQPVGEGDEVLVSALAVVELDVELDGGDTSSTKTWRSSGSELSMAGLRSSRGQEPCEHGLMSLQQPRNGMGMAEQVYHATSISELAQSCFGRSS